MVLSPREKLLIAVLVALALGSGAWFGIGGLRTHLSQLEARLAGQESLLQRAMLISAELRRLERGSAGSLAAPRPSLIGYVEQLAERVGVRDRIQLNLMQRDPGSDLQGLDIRVDRVSLDEMVQMLYTLENSDHHLVVDQLELSPSFRDKDLLRLSMRVLARQ